MRSLFLGSLLLAFGAIPALAQDDAAFTEQQRAYLAASGAPLGARAEALKGLTHKSEACVKYLDEVRRTEEEPLLRLLALRQMGLVGVDPARKIIDGVLGRAVGQERIYGLIAWSELRPVVAPDRFLEAIGRGDGPGVVHVAARALGSYPRVDAAKLLAGLLDDEDVVDATHKTAREALRKIVGNAAVGEWFAREALAKRPTFPNALPHMLRVASACGHPQTIEGVRRRLRGGPPSRRALAAIALGELEVGRGKDAAESLKRLTPMLKDRKAEIVIAAGMAMASIGPVGEAKDELINLAKTGKPALRTMALVALVGVDDPALVELAEENLSHKTSSVRFAAVECLTRLRHKESVAALIAGLDGTDGRLQFEIVRGLKTLTRADMGETHKDWAPWWESVADTFVLPEEDAEQAAPAGKKNTVERPKYYGSEIISKRVAFVVDVSGSMLETMRLDTSTVELTRLGACQVELRGVIRDLDKFTQFNLIAFANGYTAWQKGLTSARSKKKKKDAQAFVMALEANGGTNIFDPLRLAIKDTKVDTVWLLSDGAPTAGEFLFDEEILREVRRLNTTRRVAIHTISIGQESALLKKLAEQNFGRAHVR